MIKNGLYKHFKGEIYRVIGTARHTETDEVVVLYHPVGKDKQIFARPLTMFIEMVERTGSKVPRFEFCD